MLPGASQRVGYVPATTTQWSLLAALIFAFSGQLAKLAPGWNCRTLFNRAAAVSGASHNSSKFRENIQSAGRISPPDRCPQPGQSRTSEHISPGDVRISFGGSSVAESMSGSRWKHWYE